MRVREARAEDNEGLVALAAACPMEGDIGMCVDRAPDFFALNRLEGAEWKVGVAEEGAGDIVGSVAVARRCSYVEGRPTRVLYVSDLKVRADRRGGAVADALTGYVQEACAALAGRDAPVLLTILAGNTAMERRAPGPRGLPTLTRFATLRAFSVPLLPKRRGPEGGLRVGPAGEEDLEEMAELWGQVSAGRQFAPAFDAEGLRRWTHTAPGLSLSDYLLARGANGRLRGFLALWDQHAFKQLRVTSYSRRLGAIRALLNAAAPLTGAARLPPVGQALRCRTAVHVCVPPGKPSVLRALLRQGYHDLRARGDSFFTVGLDRRDPLCAALRGLWAQPTDVHAYVTTARGAYAGPALDDRPLHHEIAL